MKTDKGILLVNLGSPDSTRVADVRKYLRQFLMDKYVLDIPYLLRFFLLEAIILPRRPKESAKAYAKIWGPKGSPLIVESQKQQLALQAKTTLPVELAMRYGSMSISKAFKRLQNKGIKNILVIPLYPQYALSSYVTVVEECKKQKQRDQVLTFFSAFFDHEAYLHSLATSIKKGLPAKYDHILFSYHGIPERHITKLDAEKQCLASADCCVNPEGRLPFCYRAQSYFLSQQMIKKLGLKKEDTSTSFQSRLGKTPWIKPYTDVEIENLAKKHKHLVVICPSFVADCLETLEEIGIRAQEDFIAAGGEKLTLISCLNSEPTFIEALQKFCEEKDFV